MSSIGVGAPVGSEAFVSLVSKYVAVFLDRNRGVEGVRGENCCRGAWSTAMATKIHPQIIIRLKVEDKDGSIIHRYMKTVVLKPIAAVGDGCLHLHFFVKLDAGCLEDQLKLTTRSSAVQKGWVGVSVSGMVDKRSDMLSDSR